jgi:hypothetical protein
MKQFLILSLLVSMALALSGCASTGSAGPFGQNNTANGALMGGLVGAGAGQLLGHNTKSTLAGALIGTGVGAMAGAAHDQNQANMQGAYQQGRMDAGGYPPPPPGPPSYGSAPAPRSY